MPVRRVTFGWPLDLLEGEINEEKETIAIRALLFLSST